MNVTDHGQTWTQASEAVSMKHACILWEEWKLTMHKVNYILLSKTIENVSW